LLGRLGPWRVDRYVLLTLYQALPGNMWWPMEIGGICVALIKTEGSVGLGVLSNSWKAETVVMKNDASGMWFSPYPVYIRSDKKFQNWTWSMMLRVVSFLKREIDILVQSCSGYFNRLNLLLSTHCTSFYDRPVFKPRHCMHSFHTLIWYYYQINPLFNRIGFGKLDSEKRGSVEKFQNLFSG